MARSTSQSTASLGSSITNSSNVAVLIGAISSDPVQRELASGTTVVSFDVTTRRVDGETRSSVPVAWHDPTASAAADLVEGVEVLVVGSVRRRYFRAGGSVQSRTEVVVERLVPTRRRKSVQSLLARIGGAINPTGG